MALFKFQADAIFDGFQLLDDQWVLITDQDGMVKDLLPLADAGEEIQRFPGILSPGFVNCHCHLELSHLKGIIPEQTGLTAFLQLVMQQRHFPEEQQLAAIEEAEAAMLQNGIVAVGDICNTAITLAQKQKGRIWYHNFIEAMGWVPAGAALRFEQAVKIFYQFAAQYGVPVASNSVVPHAPYSVSPELWHRIIHFPGNHLLSLHNQESEAENELFQTGTGDFLAFYEKLKIDHRHFSPPGKSSLLSCLPYLLPNQSLLLVHNVASSANDMALAKALQNNISLYWCLCPNANQYITGQLPPVDTMIKENCTIVLGTDSLASNHELSILSEIQTLRRYFPAIPLHHILQWATSNGASALQLQQQLGSFEKEKSPGIILLANDMSAVKRLL